jgi:glycolate oxidase
VESEARLLKNFLTGQEGVLSLSEASDKKEVDALWAARRSVSPAAFDLKPHKMSEDVVVPRSRIPDLVQATEALAVEYGLTIFTFGHAGDGNIHVNIMLDRADPLEVEKAQTAKEELFKTVLGLGGTLSGEHGVGLTKSGFISLELDHNSLGLMQEIKKLFDPLDILNPGKIFPPQAAWQKK